MNNNRFFIFFIFFFTTINLFSQNQPPEKKVWVVDSDEKFYINKDLPVYIWLSTSPDENSEKHLLKSKKTKEYTNPMYFDTDGINTIKTPWAVDPETKKIKLPKEEIVFEVWADGIAPVTKSKLLGAPKYTKSEKTYYGKNLKLNLASTDNIAGVKQILFSVNGANYSAYKSDANLDNEGNTNVKFYSTDKVGNVEASKSRNFIIDLTAPVITKTMTGPLKDNILGPEAQIILESTDNLSGVKAQYYIIDGVQKKYTAPISVKKFSDGKHTLRFFSVDNVENSNKNDVKYNSGGTTDFNFIYDSFLPSVNADVIGDLHKGKFTYVSERSKIKLTAKDGTGVKEITYGIDENANKIYTDPFFLKKSEGIQSVNYKAEDEVENVSMIHKKQIFLDNKTPTTGITYKTPQFFNRDTLFINSKTNIKLFADDKDSGVKKTEYSIKDNSNFKTYNEEFKIETDGYCKVFFKSIDKVNNVEIIKESEFVVDNTSPKIYIKYSINPIRNEIREGKNYNVYPKYTKIYIAATDKWCGTEKIYYSVNGNNKTLYTSPQALYKRKLISKDGFYTITVTASDKLGNTSEHSESFIISEK